MTGPEFALSVISSMIAAVLYDMLRNPSSPVYRIESKNLLQDSQKLIRKIASRVLPSKKDEDTRPVELPEISAISGREAILKKSEGAHAHLSFVFKKASSPRPTSAILTHLDVDHFAHRAFLKTLAS